MSATKTKTFTISDHESLEKVDSWWAGLLRTGPKELVDIAWVSSGDLVWLLKLSWSKLDIDSQPFNVCMPAYASFTNTDLDELLEAAIHRRDHMKSDLSLFKKKLDDWEVIELTVDNLETPQDDFDLPVDDDLSFSIDPSLSYASKLDVVEKIMVSEFLWPYYKAMVRTYLMLEAKISEVKKEIEQRSDSSFTVVRVDRGMLRTTFINQVGYDNKWLFASDEEIFEDYYESDEEEEG